MGYYRRTRYRSWRSRSLSESSSPSKYSVLTELFGAAVERIKNSFLDFDQETRNELFSDYGAIYGESAERYAQKTFQQWKSGATKLSGQTMQRLIALVPPYLSPEQRFSVLQLVLRRHKKLSLSRTIRINVKEPDAGFAELQNVLASMSHDDVLAHLPEQVTQAASWLCDDDITAARAMLAEADRLENDLIRSKAFREIDLLRKTISTGQIKAANYSVEMPAGKLNIIAYTQSACFVDAACIGDDAIAWELQMSDSKMLTTEINGNNAVQLRDNGLKAGSLIEQSISRLNEQQVQNLMAKASEEALRLEVKNREQNLDYIVGKKVAEDHIDTFNMLERNGRTTRQIVISDIKTGAGNMRIESKSGATCFVASVAYEDPNHPDVMFLRWYRDAILMKYFIGRIFIAWYWMVGPKLAKIVASSMYLRKISRFILSKIVELLSQLR